MSTLPIDFRDGTPLAALGGAVAAVAAESGDVFTPWRDAHASRIVDVPSMLAPGQSLTVPGIAGPITFGRPPGAGGTGPTTGGEGSGNGFSLPGFAGGALSQVLGHVLPGGAGAALGSILGNSGLVSGLADAVGGVGEFGYPDLNAMGCFGGDGGPGLSDALANAGKGVLNALPGQLLNMAWQPGPDASAAEVAAHKMVTKAMEKLQSLGFDPTAIQGQLDKWFKGMTSAANVPVALGEASSSQVTLNKGGFFANRLGDPTEIVDKADKGFVIQGNPTVLCGGKPLSGLNHLCIGMKTPVAKVIHVDANILMGQASVTVLPADPEPPSAPAGGGSGSGSRAGSSGSSQGGQPAALPPKPTAKDAPPAPASAPTPAAASAPTASQSQPSVPAETTPTAPAVANPAPTPSTESNDSAGSVAPPSDAPQPASSPTPAAMPTSQATPPAASTVPEQRGWFGRQVDNFNRGLSVIGNKVSTEYGHVKLGFSIIGDSITGNVTKEQAQIYLDVADQLDKEGGATGFLLDLFPIRGAIKPLIRTRANAVLGNYGAAGWQGFLTLLGLPGGGAVAAKLAGPVAGGAVKAVDHVAPKAIPAVKEGVGKLITTAGNKIMAPGSATESVVKSLSGTLDNVYGKTKDMLQAFLKKTGRMGDEAIDAGNGLAGRAGLARDPKHIQKHLPGTDQSNKLIRKEGAAHVFTDEATLNKVEQELLARGKHTGTVRGSERYGLKYDNPIGYRIDAAGNKVPLHYAELKLDTATGLYHPIPRTGPSK